jgi:hypothetical protein
MSRIIQCHSYTSPDILSYPTLIFDEIIQGFGEIAIKMGEIMKDDVPICKLP